MSDVHSNRNDHLQTIPGFDDLLRRFPDLNVGEVIGDAGEGFDDILSYIYDDLKALRIIVPRRHTEDGSAVNGVSTTPSLTSPSTHRPKTRRQLVQPIFLLFVPSVPHFLLHWVSRLVAEALAL